MTVLIVECSALPPLDNPFEVGGLWKSRRLLGLWFDSPLLATILATGGISIFGDSSL
jgi:hypothetical protein